MVGTVKPAKSRDQSRVEPQDASKRRNRTQAKQGSRAPDEGGPSQRNQSRRASDPKKGGPSDAVLPPQAQFHVGSPAAKQAKSEQRTEPSRANQAHAQVLLASPVPALIPTLPAPHIPSVQSGQVGELLHEAFNWLGGGSDASRESLAPSHFSAATSTQAPAQNDEVLNSTETPTITSAQMRENLKVFTDAEALVFTKATAKKNAVKNPHGLSGVYNLRLIENLPPEEMAAKLIQLGDKVKMVKGSQPVAPQSVRQLLSENVPAWPQLEPKVNKVLKKSRSNNVWTDLLQISIPEHAKKFKASIQEKNSKLTPDQVSTWLQGLTVTALENDLRQASLKQQEKWHLSQSNGNGHNGRANSTSSQRPGQLNNDYINVIRGLILRNPDSYKQFALKTFGPHSPQYTRLKDARFEDDAHSDERQEFIEASILTDPHAYPGFLSHYLTTHPDQYTRFLGKIVDRILHGGFTRQQTETFLFHALGGMDTRYFSMIGQDVHQLNRGKADVPMLTSAIKAEFFSELAHSPLSGSSNDASQVNTAPNVLSPPKPKLVAREDLVKHDNSSGVLAQLFYNPQSPIDVPLLKMVLKLHVARMPADFQRFLIPKGGQFVAQSGKRILYQDAFLDVERIRWFGGDGYSTPWVSRAELRKYFESFQDNYNSKYIAPLLFAGNAMGPLVLMEANNPKRYAVGFMHVLMNAIYEHRLLDWEGLARKWNDYELPAAKEMVRPSMPESSTDAEIRRGVQQYFFNQLRSVAPRREAAFDAQRDFLSV